MIIVQSKGRNVKGYTDRALAALVRQLKRQLKT